MAADLEEPGLKVGGLRPELVVVGLQALTWLGLLMLAFTHWSWDLKEVPGGWIAILTILLVAAAYLCGVFTMTLLNPFLDWDSVRANNEARRELAKDKKAGAPLIANIVSYFTIEHPRFDEDFEGSFRNLAFRCAYLLNLALMGVAAGVFLWMKTTASCVTSLTVSGVCVALASTMYVQTHREMVQTYRSVFFFHEELRKADSRAE